VFKGGLPIREAQIVQRRDLSIVVRVVPESRGQLRWNEGHGEQLLSELRARLGSATDIRLELTDQIARTRAGKFQAVVRERA
jgi:hypothetical protein